MSSCRSIASAFAAWLVVSAAPGYLAAQNRSNTSDPDVRSLPLHVERTKASPPSALVVMLSGDGGWAGIDRKISSDLTARGIAVVGLDSRSYLMRARTPDEIAADIANVLRHFTVAWGVQRVALVGYSRGADLAPFIANRLPHPLRDRVVLIALLAPAERASFQFHWTDLLSETSKPTDPPILPELERLRGTPVLCVYGTQEKESLCRLADTAVVHVDARKGKHHFDGDYDAIAAEIIQALTPLDATRPSEK